MFYIKKSGIVSLILRIRLYTLAVTPNRDAATHIRCSDSFIFIPIEPAKCAAKCWETLHYIAIYLLFTGAFWKQVTL